MKPIEDYSDEDLRLLAAEDSVTSVDRLREGGVGAFSNATKAARLLHQLKEMRDAVRLCREKLDGAAQTILSQHVQLERAKTELAEKTAALRLTDLDALRRSVEAARDAGRAESAASCEAELTRLRVEVAQQRSEIEELRASKKKLREALDRAREGR